MDAILLVGGFGTRLLPLTKTLPKPLIPVANVPFVERTIAWLRDAGVDHVILSLHYNAEQFVEYFSQRPLGVDIDYAVEDSPLGTGGAIKNCEPFLRSARSFVCNGDIFTSLRLPEMLREHEEAGSTVSIALKEVDDPSRFGVIETQAQGRIRSFTEKPPRELAPSRDINAGIYIFERNVFDWFPDGACSVERDIFPQMLDAGAHLHGHHQYPYWTDLGTPGDYLQAHRDILSRNASVPIHAREVTPGVWVGEGVTIASDALIRPPVLLGNGVHVASIATVGPLTVLGDGVKIGANALVTDSVIWDDTTIHADSVVRGCILGRGAQVMGSVQGQVCEDNCQLQSLQPQQEPRVR